MTVVDEVELGLVCADAEGDEVCWVVKVAVSVGIVGMRSQYPSPAATTTATREIAISFEALLDSGIAPFRHQESRIVEHLEMWFSKSVFCPLVLFENTRTITIVRRTRNAVAGAASENSGIGCVGVIPRDGSPSIT